MSDFKAEMHQIVCRLGLCPRPCVYSVYFVYLYVLFNWPLAPLLQIHSSAHGYCHQKLFLQLYLHQKLAKQFMVIFGRPYYRSCLWRDVSSVVCLSVTFCIVAKRYVLAKKVSEGVNTKPGSKSSFFGSPPYFYFRFGHCSHPDGRLCLIFARTAQWSVLDGTDGLSSRKPCAYFWIVRSELKLDSGLFVCIT